MNWCCQPLSSLRQTSRGWPWHWASWPQRSGGDSTPRNWWRGRGRGDSCFWPRVENICGMWEESYLNNEELEEACVEFADDGGFCGAENRSGIWNWSIIIHSCVDFCTYLKFCLFFCWHWHFQGCKDGKFIVLGPQTSLNSRLASRSKFMENNNCRLKYVSWAIEKNFQRFQHLEVGTDIKIYRFGEDNWNLAPKLKQPVACYLS